jgi:hypothetical protein
MSANLSLLSSFPSGYTGPTANLSAVGSSYTCLQAPSALLNTSIAALPTMLGLCNNGTVPTGSYTLYQVAPANYQFVDWECYDVTYDYSAPTNLTLGAGPSVVLYGGMEVKCVARYTPDQQLSKLRRSRLRSLLVLGR